MNDQLLEIDVRVLILRYGRQKVLQTLAQLGEQTVDELEQQIRSMGQERRPKRPKPSAVEVATAVGGERPEIGEFLRNLALRYENRTFLPKLHDVQRFLDRAGSSHGRLRSRQDAAAVVIRTLAKLGREELLQLVAEERSPGESDYSLLARAIMGTLPVAKGREVDAPSQKPRKS